MARRQITCVNKTDRHNPWERIRRIGGPWGSASQEEAIRHIETGVYDYFVWRLGTAARVVVGVSRYGNKYLKTEADGEMPNNLLSLPECP